MEQYPGYSHRPGDIGLHDAIRTVLAEVEEGHYLRAVEINQRRHTIQGRPYDGGGSGATMAALAHLVAKGEVEESRNQNGARIYRRKPA
jgi:hypothetical protein